MDNLYLLKVAEMIEKEAAAIGKALDKTKDFGKKVMGGKMKALKETQSRIISNIKTSKKPLDKTLGRASLKDHHRAMRTESSAVSSARKKLAIGVGAAGGAAGGAIAANRKTKK